MIVSINFFYDEGDFPGSVDHSSYAWKLTLAVFGPVIILGFLGTGVVLLMRRKHRKRLMAVRLLHCDPETYSSGSDDLLRATAAGDSTLRVSRFVMY